MNDTASPKGQITVTLQLNGHRCRWTAVPTPGC
jgi:hypothetical protein